MEEAPNAVEGDCTKLDFGDHASADAMLAHELNQMSFQERNVINEEIHGVRTYLHRNETPELLKSSLDQLSIELENLPSKKAYDASKAFANSYISTDEFRYMFLRSEFFDVRKAAVRMAKYLDLIQWVFGDSVLERDICGADLGKKTLKFLRAGYDQMLPGRDRSGRRVLWSFTNSSDWECKLSCLIYIGNRLVTTDVNIQRRGIVLVVWSHNYHEGNLNNRTWIRKLLINAMPIRLNAIHFCVPNHVNKLYEMTSSLFMMSIGSENRKRIRLQFGSATECMYMLQTFGIHSLQMPIYIGTGKIKTVDHHKWLELHQKREVAVQDNNIFEGIECPELGDVLFGRGWPKMTHPGNAVFRSTIEARLEHYNKAKTKRDKTMIAWSVVCELRDCGARFLRENTTGWWIEVSNEVARQKVSIGFRDVRKARQKSSKSKSAATNNNNDEASLPQPTLSSSNDAVASREGISKRKVIAANNPPVKVGEDDITHAFLNMDGSGRKRCRPCDGHGDLT